MKPCMLSLASAAVLAASTAFAAPSANWLAVWAAPPSPSAPANKGFENQTIRQVVRLSADGRRVRHPADQRVWRRTPNGWRCDHRLCVVPRRPQGRSAPIPLTFGGRASVTVPTRGPIYSDPVDLPVKALESVSISLLCLGPRPGLHLPQPASRRHTSPAPGDFTRADFSPAVHRH